MINQFIHKILLSLDPNISLFNKFYSQLLLSKEILNSPSCERKYLGKSYNLMTQRDEDILHCFIKECHSGSLLEFGCGLSPCSLLLDQSSESHLSLTGIDFSSFAIQINRKKFPQYKFIQHHQKISLKTNFDFIVITDALYKNSRKFNFTKSLKGLLKRCNKRAIVIQNHALREVKEIQKLSSQTVDTTEAFYHYVQDWLNFLETAGVKDERKNFCLLWDTIRKEMTYHSKQLENQNIKRMITFYEI